MWCFHVPFNVYPMEGRSQRFKYLGDRRRVSPLLLRRQSLPLLIASASRREWIMMLIIVIYGPLPSHLVEIAWTCWQAINCWANDIPIYAIWFMPSLRSIMSFMAPATSVGDLLSFPHLFSLYLSSDGKHLACGGLQAATARFGWRVDRAAKWFPSGAMPE